jgi:hypothetical protein
MKSNRVRTLTIATLACTCVAWAPDADAHGRRVRRGPAPASLFPAEGYTTIKAGGYSLDRTVDGVNGLGGIFVGAEAGVTPSPYVQLGASVDWLRRREGTTESLVIDAPYELPVHGEVDVSGTATDLVPFGGVVRLRYPVSMGRFVPYLAGHLTLDTLRLEYHELLHDGATQIVAHGSDFFFGMGTTLALGVEARVDPSFGFVFEAGVHDSNPEKDLIVDGVPVTGVVDAGGEFVRLGMSFNFS